MAFTLSFCRDTVRLLSIDVRTILSSLYFTRSVTSNPTKNGHGHFRWPAQYWASTFAAASATRTAYNACDNHDVNTQCMSHLSQEFKAMGGGDSRCASGDNFVIATQNNLVFNLTANHGFVIKGAKKYTTVPIFYIPRVRRFGRRRLRRSLSA